MKVSVKSHVQFVGSKDPKGSFVIAKLTKSSHFTPAQPRAETTLEKTSRVVKEITEQESDKRQEKIARLRKARHESEAENAKKSLMLSLCQEKREHD